MGVQTCRWVNHKFRQLCSDGLSVYFVCIFHGYTIHCTIMCRSQRQRSLKRASTAARLWDCGFETHMGFECLSLVSVVCCQVEDSAFGWSPLQRNPLDCGVSECDREASNMRRPWSTRGYCAIKCTIMYILNILLIIVPYITNPGTV